MAILQAEHITVKISGKTILHNISTVLPEGKVTAIIGPNGSGKSTFLKTLVHVHKCSKGRVMLNARDISTYKHLEFAKEVAILPQNPEAPSDLTVEDLVSLGRFPYRKWYGNFITKRDKEVEWALQKTGMERFVTRILASLSGGERQRAWLAMALAQKPQILLLDEPTTYLDICHQLEIMELLNVINAELQITIIMVLHDLNHALQYADHILALEDGHIIAEGEPKNVITNTLLENLFKVKSAAFTTDTGKDVIIPVELIKK